MPSSQRPSGTQLELNKSGLLLLALRETSHRGEPRRVSVSGCPKGVKVFGLVGSSGESLRKQDLALLDAARIGCCQQARGIVLSYRHKSCLQGGEARAVVGEEAAVPRLPGLMVVVGGCLVMFVVWTVFVFCLWSDKILRSLVFLLFCHDWSGLARCLCSVTFMFTRNMPGQCLATPGRADGTRPASGCQGCFFSFS